MSWALDQLLFNLFQYAQLICTAAILISLAISEYLPLVMYATATENSKQQQKGDALPDWLMRPHLVAGIMLRTSQ